MIYCGFALVTSLILEDALLTMAESTITTEVKPYQFELTTVVLYSHEESDSDDSDTDVQEQASFMEPLGKVDWYCCLKCVPMLCGIKCQCNREMNIVHEQLVEQDEISYIVCLNKDVLHTTLVMINRKGVNLCDFLCQTGMLIRIIENVIHECVIVNKLGNSFTGHIIG